MGKKARIVPQRRPTKRQLSRWQREKQVQRMALAAGAFVILLVLAIPLFGFAREYAFKGQEPVVRVDQAVLTLSEYAQIIGLRKYIFDVQIDNLRGVAGQADSPLQASLQNLELARSALPTQVVEDWIAERLVRQETSRLGITISPEEVTASIKPEFDPSPAGGGEPKPLSGEEFQTRYRDFLSRARASDALYRRQKEFLLLAEKLLDQMGQVPSSAPQVHLQAILLTTEEEANEAKARLERGEDFALVAQEVSRDLPSKEDGGDLGWAPRGLLDKELEDAVFAAPVGQLGGPVKATGGYRIFKVLEKEASRQVEPSTAERVKEMSFQRWLAAAQQDHRVERYLTADKVDWAQKQSRRR